MKRLFCLILAALLLPGAFCAGLAEDMEIMEWEPEEEPGIPLDAGHFPDHSFRAYLGESFDADGDGILSEAERMGITEIDVEEKGISSLEGLEYFPELVKLICRHNQLTELDVSQNPELRFLYCSHSQLSGLNVRQNLELESLNCSGNQLSELNISNNAGLCSLLCHGNSLESIDIGNCPVLVSAAESGAKNTIYGYRYVSYEMETDDRYVMIYLDTSTALVGGDTVYYAP